MFLLIQFEHVPREYNKQADTLATLASNIDILDKSIDVNTVKNSLQAITADLIPTNLSASKFRIPLSFRIFFNNFQLWSREN